MGRQILFHASTDDLVEFLELACRRDPVIVTLRDSDQQQIEPLPNPATETRVMTLWNQQLVATLQRELVRRPPSSDYYRIAYSLPVLELSPSLSVLWNARSALLRGRLYGFAFDSAPVAYTKWYSALSRWIRSHFAKNPFSQLDGYVGPAALTWFKQGGILLPWPAPPVSQEWQSFVEAQHRARSAIAP